MEYTGTENQARWETILLDKQIRKGENQFSSVAQSCPTLYNPTNSSTSGFPVDHQLPEFNQTHFHWVSDAIQLSHPLSYPSPPTFNLSQHQVLYQWVSSLHQFRSVQSFSVQLFSMPGFPVYHQLPEFTQTHVHWVGDVIQPSHPLSSLCPPTFNLFHHQDLFKWVSSSHQVAKILEFQLKHQSFQWTLRTDLL